MTGLRGEDPFLSPVEKRARILDDMAARMQDGTHARRHAHWRIGDVGPADRGPSRAAVVSSLHEAVPAPAAFTAASLLAGRRPSASLIHRAVSQTASRSTPVCRPSPCNM